MSRALPVALLVLLALAAPALFAQAPEHLVFDARNGRLLPGARAQGPLQWPAMRASQLIGHEVVDRRHRDFGEIRELVLDSQRRRISAVVIDRRDDWQAGEALVKVPIEALSLPRDLGDRIALNYGRERFE